MTLTLIRLFQMQKVNYDLLIIYWVFSIYINSSLTRFFIQLIDSSTNSKGKSLRRSEGIDEFDENFPKQLNKKIKNEHRIMIFTKQILYINFICIMIGIFFMYTYLS